MGYRVLTIGDVGAISGGFGRGRGRGLGGGYGRGGGRGLGLLSQGEFAQQMIRAADFGYNAGWKGEQRQVLMVAAASPEQLKKLQREYDGGYQRGDARRRAGGLPREGDGTPVPGGDPPPDGGSPSKGAGKPKMGGAALVMCSVDKGKGGWRKVGGRWHYAHHKDLILSALAERYLGDAGQWKKIYNESKERGLLPSGSTPDKIMVIDGNGDRVLFYMPDQAIENAYEKGCIPDKGDVGGFGKMSTGMKWGLGLAAAGTAAALLYWGTRD